MRVRAIASIPQPVSPTSKPTNVQLTVTKNATDHCFEMFHIAEQVAMAAPNVKKFDISIYNLGNRPFCHDASISA